MRAPTFNRLTSAACFSFSSCSLLRSVSPVGFVCRQRRTCVSLTGILKSL